jgi:hypothetical protein
VSEVDGLHALLQRHGPELVRAAFAHALEQETYGTEYVAHYLGQMRVTTEQRELPL